MYILQEDQLKKLVPSIFSAEAHEKTSDKYALIPTIECVRGLQKSGFYPVKAKQSTCRNSDNRPYVTHMIRFRKEGIYHVGGNVPEIVMINSHNGTTSYQLRAGIYRLVCSNGLVVGNDLFCRRVKHQGDVISKVVESAEDIIEIIPKAIEFAEKWKAIDLKQEQRIAYAQSAMMLKWDKNEIELPAENILSVRRREDSIPTLWNTFNVLQENIINGGVRYRSKSKETGRVTRNSTRAVNSVSENSRLNTALWNLTEKMAELAIA